MSIAANKVKGIRCALVHDVFSAKATREHNDSNILAMGERVIGPGLAREIVATWLNTIIRRRPSRTPNRQIDGARRLTDESGSS